MLVIVIKRSTQDVPENGFWERVTKSKAESGKRSRKRERGKGVWGNNKVKEKEAKVIKDCHNWILKGYRLIRKWPKIEGIVKTSRGVQIWSIS